MADMVTLDENELYGQRDKIKKWDLMDMTKRDAWLITLYAARSARTRTPTPR